MTVPTPVPTGGTGESLFLSQLSTIDRIVKFICKRHHVKADDADDFAADVRLRCVENDYAILRKFGGRSSFKTYLTVVIERMFLDYRIRAWGKWRPCAAARRTGPVGVLLDQLLTRDGRSFDEAYGILTATHGVAASRAELEEVAAQFPARTKRSFETEDALADLASSEPSPDEELATSEQQVIVDDLARALRRLTHSFDPLDQLILRLRFEDGETVPTIAHMLRLDAKPLYRRVERLLDTLRKSLESEGHTADGVRDLLDQRGLVDWRSEDGISGKRPSIEKGAHEWR
jgi:RNA polymerase sigma factor for flagellar operon FliA